MNQQTYIIKFTKSGKVSKVWERQGKDMESVLLNAKLEHVDNYGPYGGVFICRKEG